MRVSIITVVYNNVAYVKECIKSVLGQTYKDIEYIVIDGGSTDGTVDVVQEYRGEISKFITEPDKGIYDALNKGIRLCSGDIVGILHSDDIYIDNNVISRVVEEFKNRSVDCVFADLVFAKREDSRRIVRYYSSASFNPAKFAYGWMPAHPTFFVKRFFYEENGLFKTDYKIASDFELMVRFLWTSRLSYSYIPEVLVKMRDGGLSTKSLKSNLILNKEIIRACAENNIKTNYLKVYSKYFTKIFQLIKRNEYFNQRR